MAKTLVIDTRARTQVPFLRGILTRSLQDAGLPFGEAYEMAALVRDDLKDTPLVTTRELRANVLKRLRAGGRREASLRYRNLRDTVRPILVEDDDDQLVPFSRGRHQRSLLAAGIDPHDAALVSQHVFEYLLEQHVAQMPGEHIGGLTHGCLRHLVGETAARHYLVWMHFLRSGRPLVLLIGGTAGSGKSTVATMIASRLEIVRTQSTDMLREIMRLTIPKRLLPVLHASSFNAWRALPGRHGVKVCSDELLADGFHAQAELIWVACEAVIRRALRERVSLVLEGVHVNPPFLDRLPPVEDALVVPVTLAVPDRSMLERRIRGRGRDVPQRRAARYLRGFDEIWRLQSLLLGEAEEQGVPIVENDDRDRVFRDVMRIVIEKLDVDFRHSVRDVFGAGAKARRERYTAHAAEAGKADRRDRQATRESAHG